MKLGILYYGIFIISCAVTFKLVNLKVTEPFIDEIFHLRQCQKYCAYKFNEWDNKITTPPGLYIFGLGYTYILNILTPSETLVQLCASQGVLRSLNLVGGTVVLPLILQGLTRGSRNKNFLVANIVSIPLLFTYYFLFYTDIWASILVILAIYLALQAPVVGRVTSVYLSGFVTFLSLWFRQTNILWIVFITVLLIEDRVKEKQIHEKSQRGNFFNQIIDFIVQALNDWVLVLPFALVSLAFVGFVHYNGGITLGDKENHAFDLHLAQVFYCFTFMTFFTVPAWLEEGTAKRYLASSFGSLGRIVATALSFYLIKYVIDNFSVVHPFLLADNRHYTFYLWRRLLSKANARFVLVPLYHFSTWNIVSGLHSKTQTSKLQLTPISIIAFIVVICVTIIPSPLFEPRYYILPLTLFRIFLGPLPRPNINLRLSLEFLYSMLINLATVTIFLNYEFKWDTETSLQRIIW